MRYRSWRASESRLVIPAVGFMIVACCWSCSSSSRSAPFDTPTSLIGTTVSPLPATSAPTSMAYETVMTMTSATSDILSANELILTCSDSVGPGTPADINDVAIGGITFSGIPNAGPAPAASMPIGPESDPYSFRKTFLYVAPTAADETLIEVIAPDDGRVYYTNEDHWGQQPTSKLLTDSAKSAVIPRCGDTSRGFLGGFMAHGSNCATLRITSGSTAPTTIRIPINSGTC